MVPAAGNIAATAADAIPTVTVIIATGNQNMNARFVRPVAVNIANRLLFRQPEM